MNSVRLELGVEQVHNCDGEGYVRGAVAFYFADIQIHVDHVDLDFLPLSKT